jgi:hypothetical protein
MWKKWHLGIEPKASFLSPCFLTVKNINTFIYNLESSSGCHVGITDIQNTFDKENC